MESTIPETTRRRTVLHLLPPFISWGVGLLVMAWPTFASGFRLVQGGLGDSRLINFALEHSYRWLAGMPLAGDLWSPPIFYPVSGVATYTDLLLGVAPLYWLWRWFGAEPHTAYQLWMLTCWTLNFASFYLLLHRGFRIRALSASAGAYLFAFASPRFMSMAHQQLVPQFWLVTTLVGLVMLFDANPNPSPRRRWLACIAFWGGLVAQLYTAVYPLAFFSLGLAAAAVVGLAIPSMRGPLIRAVKRHAIPLIAVGVIVIGLAAPLALRYRATAAIIGVHAQSHVHLPKPLSWLLPGNSNRLYGKSLMALDLDEYRGFSQTNGIGAVTLVACVVGLWLGRRRREVQLLTVGLVALFLLTVTLPGGWSPWWVVRDIVPGAAAIRAVARVGLMTLFPAAIGLAIAVDRLLTGRRWISVAILITIIAAEQPHRRPSFDKAAATTRVENIASRVPANAETFLIVVDGPRWDKYVHDDAAWVALATGIPTVNGRYGHFPPDYPFRTPWIQQRPEGTQIRSALETWLAGHGHGPRSGAMIRVTPRPPRARGGRR